MSGETLRIRRQVTEGNLLFGEYTLLRVVAQGPSSLICEAEHNSLKRRCAVKTVHPDRVGPLALAAVDGMLREARALAQIEHPHVVGIYHAGTVGPKPFLAMRLVRGGTLASRLGRGALAPETVARLLAEGALALRAVQAAGLVHGAVAPEHLLLDTDGTLRLAGFSHAADARDPRPPVPTGAWWLAPELAQGGVVDQRADCYALCACLALALGVRPEGIRPDLAPAQIGIAALTASPGAGGGELLAPLTRLLARGLVGAVAGRIGSAQELWEGATALLRANAAGAALPAVR